MSRLKTAVMAGLATALFSLAARGQTPGPKPAMVATATPSAGVVNLNEANPEELERLPGIGPAKARAIVEHRHAHPFKKVEDITKVKGIGKKTFAKLRPYISMSGATTLKTEPHP